MEGEADKEESTTGYKERGKWEVYCGVGCEITSIYWLKVAMRPTRLQIPAKTTSMSGWSQHWQNRD